MNQKPFFSIIIPTLNEQDYISSLLTDLTKQTFKNFEVILVDARSEDKTVSKSKKLDQKLLLKIISTKTRNVSYQRNLGAKSAKGEYLIFNDADNRLPPFFLEGIKYQLTAHPTDLFTCWSNADPERTTNKTIATAYNLILESSLLTKSPTALGAMIGCKTSVFKKGPGFDKDVGFAEDTDFIRAYFNRGSSFKIFRDPRYIYSLRRFHSQGSIKVIQKSAKLFLKYLTGQKVDQEKEYPMGGKNHQVKNPDLIQKINDFLNTPIKTPKILEKLQSILNSESQ